MLRHSYSATTSNYGLAYRQGSIPPSLSCRFAQAVATDSLLGCQLNATALSNTLGWWNEEGVVLTGEALQRYGIRPPSLHPQQAVLLKAVALS